ncbi:hypothetical protein AYO47_08390 [Planctomyces sp. SCGC AG-212-M04]|nr:hypothetical protein AYO47_08390 [Planctomyces sp. SCGC AG-212-M04]
MTFDPIPYNLPLAFGTFLIALIAVSTIALIVGLVVSLLTVGTHGPGLVWETMQRGWRDLTQMSLRRIGAISSLTIKESFRKKAFWVLVVFFIVFLFAGWFLQDDDPSRETPAKPFIAFVLTTIQWMTLPVALLLSCWGLPTDIKDRSLHTVVTKPVRRGEVVLGRIFGYGAVLTIFIVVMGIGGYFFVTRSVPPAAQKELVSRVPVYGTVAFLDRNGEPSATGKGLNVGDIWEFRSYIEGVTKGSMTWTFRNLDVSELAQHDTLRLENRFEAFRSYKGQINEPVRYKLTLVNNSNGLRISNGDLVKGIAEFQEERVRKDDVTAAAKDASDEKFATAYRIQPSAVVEVPRKVKYIDVATGAGKEADLYNDIIDKGTLTIEVTCPDAQQYIGAAQSDLFIRLPDRSFASTYFKSIFMTWLMLMLICMVGATASTFVKGPVATLLTFSLILLGAYLRPGMEKMVEDYTKGQVLGGGALESFYRLITQMNQQQPLPDNFGSRLMVWVDSGILEVLRQMRHVIPNFSYFNTTEYSANGFDVPLDAALLPGIATALAYLIPCLLIGYFSLALRELEAK